MSPIGFTQSIDLSSLPRKTCREIEEHGGEDGAQRPRSRDLAVAIAARTKGCKLPLKVPPFDEELSKELPSIRRLVPASVLPAHIPDLRASNLAAPSIDTVIEGKAIVHHQFTATSVPGLPSVEISVFAPIGAMPRWEQNACRDSIPPREWPSVSIT